MDLEVQLFKNRTPIGPLKIIGMENCRELAEMSNQRIVKLRQDMLAQDPSFSGREYDKENYLIKAQCPRFGSGEGKGVINETVRGSDLYIISDVTNSSLTFSINGRVHYMSPDDHFADLKRIVSAAMTSASRVSVIMPFLYESRQHKREFRESLDCSVALKELCAMGVSNIITFDAHDARVQNSIPLHDFDNYTPIYQLLKALESKFGSFELKKDEVVVITPDEGAMERAIFLANNVGVGLGMFYRRRDYTRYEGKEHPVVSCEYLGPDVEGKTVIVLDDIISTGTRMLEAASELKKMKAKRVIMMCSFPLFTNGLEPFDKAYKEGWFDYICSTNLVYRRPELKERPWYLEADLSTYMAKIINTMNHNVAVTSVITPTEKLQEFVKRHQS